MRDLHIILVTSGINLNVSVTTHRISKIFFISKIFASLYDTTNKEKQQVHIQFYYK